MEGQILANRDGVNLTVFQCFHFWILQLRIWAGLFPEAKAALVSAKENKFQELRWFSVILISLFIWKPGDTNNIQ